MARAAIVTASVPSSANTPSNAVDLSVTRNNFDAVEDWFTNTQHYTLTNALSGQHISGVCGLVGVYSLAEYNALQEASGAAAAGATIISSTYGELLRANTAGGSYAAFPTTGEYSGFVADLTLSLSVVPATITILPISSVTYDGLSEFDHAADYDFTAKADGYYYVACSVCFDAGVVIPTLHLYTYVNGLLATEVAVGSKSLYTSASVYDVLYLAASDYVNFKVLHDAAAAKTLIHIAASIVRLS